MNCSISRKIRNMGRPRKDEVGPTAKERMQLAFWDELALNAYHKITVSAIVQRAGVNRNAFYYHYSDMNALARDAIQHELENGDVPHALVMTLQAPPDALENALSARLHDGLVPARIERALLLCGPHSTPELLGILRNALRIAWLDIVGVDENALSPADRLSLDFLLGGVLALFPQWTTTIKQLNPERLASIPIIQDAVRNVLSIGQEPLAQP